MAGESHSAQQPPMKGLRDLGHYALVYLFEGHGQYCDIRGTQRALNSGDCFLLFPDIPHHYAPTDNTADWNEFYIVFEGLVFDVWRKEGLLLESDCFFLLEPVYLWLKRFREVVDRKAIPSPQSSLADLSRLQLLMADILGNQARKLIGDDEWSWLQRAYALISKARTERPDFHAMAQTLGVSHDGFRRRFTRLSGRSPMQYHIVQMIDRACKLLYSTRKTGAEISAEIGFCDEYYFSRQFKKITGKSPRAFRTRFLASDVGRQITQEIAHIPHGHCERRGG